MPHFLRLLDNNLYDLGETPLLGFPTSSPLYIPDDYLKQGEFMIMRMCNGLGDWGIISSLPRLLKEKYPDCKVYLPSENMIKRLFGNSHNWDHWPDPEKNVKRIFQNNPYVDDFVDSIKGEVFHDHYRIYKEGEQDPLVKQILLFWQFSENEIQNYYPELYFTKNEIEEGNRIIQQYFSDKKFGGLICTTSKLEDGKFFNSEENGKIINILQQNPTKYVYYGGVDIKDTPFKDYVDVALDFGKEEIPLRIQLYIRSKAEFNVGYQSSIFDSICRYSKIFCTKMEGEDGSNTFNCISYL